MYGYLTKQRILNGIIDLIKIGGVPKETRFQYEMIEGLAKTSSLIASKHIANLSTDGYIVMNKVGDNVWVNITDKGASAALGRYFLKEHHKSLAIIVRDAVLVFSNICVAIVAYLALIKEGSNKIESLQLDISKIKPMIEKLQKEQDILNSQIFHYRKDTLKVSLIKSFQRSENQANPK